MTAKILLVDDEPALVLTLRANLTKEGYLVCTANDGNGALKVAREQKPDLIVLDVVLPDIDGFDVCRELRKESDVPVLMLSGKAEEVDRIVGLEIGADCYATKPFSLRELLAQIKALLRRTRVQHPADGADVDAHPTRLEVGDLVIDFGWHRVICRGKVLPLKPKEFDLLVLLARNRGMVMTRERLLERVWGYEYGGDTRTLDVYIHWLREKIERDPSHPECIQTVRGVGYCLTG